MASYILAVLDKQERWLQIYEPTDQISFCLSLQPSYPQNYNKHGSRNKVNIQ